MTSVVIIGGGPGGMEAAFRARQLGGDVTLVQEEGAGGSAVLTDVIPSKTLISVGQRIAQIREAGLFGVRLKDGGEDVWSAMQVDMRQVNKRIRRLARAQSEDYDHRLREEGVRIVAGHGRLQDSRTVIAETADGPQTIPAEVILIATGGHSRVLPTAMPDGERILNWQQLYYLKELPEHLIVVGSGVTGAEFSSAYQALGAHVTLVSSRGTILPGADPDAGAALQQTFTQRGIRVINNAHAESVTRDGDGVLVQLAGGEQVRGSHALVAVGAIPNTTGIGLETVGVATTPSGHIIIDRVSRTSVRGIYAAGDCADGMKLASVAGMQGRIAMEHSLGDAVTPYSDRTVASGVFTSPEIASVGVTQQDVDSGAIVARAVTVELAANARTKMKEADGGFVKIFCLPTTHIVVGGVIVSFWATELIHSLSLAVKHKLTVEQLADAFTVYPSLSGSIAEAARRLHGHEGEAVILY
ncbi:MAG: NAD(P)H-quinone dehydrogenase [Propionibacteriaceae bacterium]|nr:NAD(P)H-quinone dehydrogenase [Propionibacteriaceae bacterium]